MPALANTTRAIVAHEPQSNQLNFKLEHVTLRDIGADELLIKVVAVGVCHTDLIFGTWPPEMIPYPKVLGHEGAGIVLKAGSGVKTASAGDSVLLSFQSCKSCQSCKTNHPSFCNSFSETNYGGESDVYTTAENTVRGSFFGQSSFAERTIAKESSVVNVSHLVKDEEELKLFAPLGCGFQTGAGTVDKVALASEKDSVVIMGLGGVGLVSIMTAKLRNCRTIIGVDRTPERIELAKTLGATHVINTSNKEIDIAKEIRAITDGNGSTVTIDTTGNMDLIRAGMDFTGSRGQMIIVGVPPPDALLNVHLITFMQTGKILRGTIEGDATPSEYIPQMIEWYREGNFPIDKLVKFYAV
ncbi:chaperonin 10-like protein [Ilyonectria destructans]|nr:chaperonin 10-like protein [Ilyonectria destructans]